MENTEQNIPTSKIGDFKEIIGSFSELLEQENDALEKFDLIRVSEMYDQKAKLVTAYRNMVAYFIKNQEQLQALEEVEQQNLKEISLRLDGLLKQNETLLKAKMQTSKLVMDTIVSTAKMSNNTNATSYGSQGKYSPLDNNSNALSVNRTL